MSPRGNQIVLMEGSSRWRDASSTRRASWLTLTRLPGKARGEDTSAPRVESDGRCTMSDTLEQDSHAVVILGMHRSGTSCLAGSLQQQGLYLGDVCEQNSDNAKGNRENVAIMTLNDHVLADSGGRWDAPPKQIVWNAEQENQRDAVLAAIKSGADGPWGFKDPRTLITLSFWQDGLVNVQLVGTFRHPLVVASSLSVRNGMPIDVGLRLWQHYNQELLTHYRHHRFPLVSFDARAEEYLTVIDRLGQRLGLPGRDATEGHPFFAGQLRHHQDLDRDTSLPDDVRQVYLELCAIYETEFPS